MKAWFKLFAVAVAALLIGGAASAGEDGKKGEGKRGNLFERADTNKDGKIDKDELAAIKDEKPLAALKKADANGDGVIDEKEIAAAKEAFKKRAEEKKAKDGGGEKKEEKKEETK